MKKADLNAMLQLLDEKNIANTVGISCYMARNTYPMRKPTVNNFDELLEEATGFFQHMHRAVVGMGKITMPDWMAAGHARGILERIGIEDAYTIASEGIRGGLHTIFEAIYRQINEEMEERYIELVLVKYVDPVDWDDRIELMRQYLQRFARNIPANKQPKKAAELAVNYKEIIKMHMKYLQGIRGKLTR